MSSPINFLFLFFLLLGRNTPVKFKLDLSRKKKKKKKEFKEDLTNMAKLHTKEGASSIQRGIGFETVHLTSLLVTQFVFLFKTSLIKFEMCYIDYHILCKDKITRI